MNDDYIVLTDWGDHETTEEVAGLEFAIDTAEHHMESGGAYYAAVIDAEGNKLVEYMV